MTDPPASGRRPSLTDKKSPVHIEFDFVESPDGTYMNVFATTRYAVNNVQMNKPFAARFK